MAIIDILRNASVCPIPQIENPTSSPEKWANYVLKACRSENDLRTLGMWAREVAVSYTTLCESCRLIGIQPRHARDFTRILRVILRASCDPHQVADFLDISDRRTLYGILESAGFSQHQMVSGRISMLSFLNNQRFIPGDNTGVRVIREVLVTSKFGMESGEMDQSDEVENHSRAFAV